MGMPTVVEITLVINNSSSPPPPKSHLSGVYYYHLPTASVGQLYCLQARPIVTLPPSCFFDGEKEGMATLWDNSNIVESYSGVTSPLTFSFASYAYELVHLFPIAISCFAISTFSAPGVHNYHDNGRGSP